MDIFSIEMIVRELQTVLPGARFNKVHQPGPDDLILRLWTGREEVRLLISAAPRLCRIHLTEQTFPNPFTPPRFCQLLRSRLAAVKDVGQIPGERIVRLGCRGRSGEDYVLVAELLGRHANLILLEGEGTIVDALKRSSGDETRRSILPGRTYRLPVSSGRSPLAEGLPPIPTGVAAAADVFEQWLLDTLTPMSPIMAKGLAAEVAGGRDAEEALARFRARWLERDWHPMVGELEGKTVLLPFAPPVLELCNPTEFPDLSAAADYFYRTEVKQSGTLGDRGELEKAVRRGLKRLKSRLKNIQTEQREIVDFDHQRAIGELVLANLHRLRKGMSEVILEDYYQDPPMPVTIMLDPRLSPHENAERYFKGFKKAKRGVAHVARRIEETQEEQTWLEQVALALEEADSAEELLAIRRELEEAGLVQKVAEPASRRRTPDPKEQLRQAKTPGGFALYWGKNNRTNDYVSRQLTTEDDLWFHAHNLPGCHLVLKRGSHQGAVPEEDVLVAASLAAGYSRGKDSSKVEVMVADGRDVRKPKGARPGLVTVQRYRTRMVQPMRQADDAG